MSEKTTDDVRCLFPAGDRCGEGAVWDADAGAVYWTDINRFLIRRHELESGATHAWFFEEPVVALALTTRPNTLLVALASRIILWRPADDTRTDHGFALEGSPKVRLNDGRASPSGEFWVGSMKNNVNPNGTAGEVAPGLGKLFRLHADGRTETLLDGLGIANTLCWSPDRTRFYFADTMANRLDAYPYDAETGAIGAPTPHLVDHPRGVPDGSSIDAEGHVWNCRYDGGCIIKVAPDGTVADIVEMPVTNITTCVFGGPDLKTLIVTTAGAGAPEAERLAGGLFALDVDVPGLPENRVRL